jgi:hypothetical protein
MRFSEFVKNATDMCGVTDTYSSSSNGEIAGYAFSVLQDILRTLNTDDQFPTDVFDVQANPGQDSWWGDISDDKIDTNHINLGFKPAAPPLKVIFNANQFYQVPIEELYTIPAQRWLYGATTDWIDDKEVWKIRLMLPAGLTTFVWKRSLTIPEYITDQVKLPQNVIAYAKLLLASRLGIHYGIEEASSLAKAAREEYGRLTKHQSYVAPLQLMETGTAYNLYSVYDGGY